MKKEEADILIMKFTRPIYGFCIRREKNSFAAEELAGRIILEIYEMLLKKDDIRNPKAYMYRIAHNVWARHLMEKSGDQDMCSIDMLSLPSRNESADSLMITKETESTLRREIAFLSKQRRQIIVLHYYKFKKVREIAGILGLSEGTVKWHLHDARKDLEKGMDKIRKIGKQGIEPISLINMGHSGYTGKEGDTKDILKSKLSQNIIWYTYNEPKTILEISEELGINPIFVEDEVSRLKEMDFLTEIKDGRFQSDIYIAVPSDEKMNMEHTIMKKYASLIVDGYYRDFIKNIDSVISKVHYYPFENRNSLIWTLVLYSGQFLWFEDNEKIKYDDIVIHRKDGGKYIALAELEKENTSSLNSDTNRVRGDMWRGDYDKTVRAWQLCTYWTSRDLGWRDFTLSDLINLADFINGTLKQTEQNADIFKNLIDKCYIKADKNSYVVNTAYTKGPKSQEDLKAAIPVPSEELKSIIKNFGLELKQAFMIDEPENARKYIDFFCQNIATLPSFRPYIIKELLKRDLIAELDPDSESGMGMLVFIQ